MAARQGWVEWAGVGWCGLEWVGVGWSGLVWAGVGWCGWKSCVLDRGWVFGNLTAQHTQLNWNIGRENKDLISIHLAVSTL